MPNLITEELIVDVSIVATAGQTAFDFDFPIFEETDAVITVDGEDVSFDATPVGTEQYSVAGANDPDGFTITFGAGLTAGQVVRGRRHVIRRRAIDLPTTGPYSSDQIDLEFDRLMAIAQEIDANHDALDSRAVLVPYGETGLELPAEADRANGGVGSIAGYDGAGNPTAIDVPTSEDEPFVAEAQRRVGGDALLGARIEQEEDARIAADEAFDVRLDADETALTAVQAAIAAGSAAEVATVFKATKALLDADLAHDAGTFALVYADGDPSLIGLYVKAGASGAGSWGLTGIFATAAQAVVQPLVDDAEAAAAAAAASEAILAANGAGAVKHDDDAAAARPAVSLAIFSGSVDPDNREDGDLLVIRQGLAQVRDHRPPPFGDDLAMRLWADRIDPEFNAPTNKMKDWLDVSGSNNHLFRFTDSLKPSYVAADADFNNRAVANFDGVDDYMVQVQMATVPQPFTVAIIAKCAAVGGASEQAIFDSLLNDAGFRVRLLLDRAGFVTVWAGTAFVTSTAAASTDLRLFILHMEGASTTLHVNGPQVLTGNPGTGALRNLHLGRDSSGNNRFGGKIHLFDIIKRGITADERSYYENFAAGHCGAVIS